MNEPYFVNIYNTGELMANLNALVSQGYEIVNITGHHNEKSSEFTVVAKNTRTVTCDCYKHYHQCCDICQRAQNKKILKDNCDT